MEGVEDGNYHLVSRWLPTEGDLYELGNDMKSLAEETIKETFEAR